MRASDDPRLKDIGILIRPHPARLDEWKRVDLSGYRNVAFWGAHPVDDEAKDDYFDSMYYSAAVVGLNTSAFIEAAVVGKPVHTVLAARDLRRTTRKARCTSATCSTVNGGLLRAARTLDEHLPHAGRRRWPAMAAATRRRRGSWRASSVRSGATRRRRRGSSTRSSASVAAAGAAPEGTAAGRGAVCGCRSTRWRRCWPLHAAHAAVAQADAEPAAQGATRRWKRRVLRGPQAVRRSAAAPGKPRPVVDAAAASALTPKLGRQRDPAKTLAGWDVAEAREARELVTRARPQRQADHPRSVAVGDRLRAALLDSVPGLGQDLRQLRSRAAGRRLARRRGAVVLATSRRTTRTSSRFYTPDEFRAHERASASPSRTGARSTSRSRRSIARSSTRVQAQARAERRRGCCIRRRCTSCSSTSGSSGRR